MKQKGKRKSRSWGNFPPHVVAPATAASIFKAIGFSKKKQREVKEFFARQSSKGRPP
jgi:hypothetical protein